MVGNGVGDGVGTGVGAGVTLIVGDGVALIVGAGVGLFVGDFVGVPVGGSVGVPGTTVGRSSAAIALARLKQKLGMIVESFRETNGSAFRHFFPVHDEK